MNNSTTQQDLVTQQQLGSRGLVWRCSDCERWDDDSAGRVRHSSRCNFHDLPKASARPQAKAPSAATVCAAVKRGEAALYLTDDELVGAVRHGAVTESDAMNQDF